METDVTVRDFSTEPFASLRTTPWEPSFDWQSRRVGAALQINKWHENGKEHYEQTDSAIQYLEVVGEWTGLAITESIIKRTHTEIFPGEKWTGKWRDIRVRVGTHVPPAPEEIELHMENLERHILNYCRTIEDLTDWYYAFETIHPFQDGNGRVGGAIVAAYSHLIEPDKGYLAPNQ